MSNDPGFNASLSINEAQTAGGNGRFGDGSRMDSSAVDSMSKVTLALLLKIVSFLQQCNED